MTGTTERTQTGHIRALGGLTVLAAVSLLAAACTTDPGDSGITGPALDPAESTTTVGARNAEPETTVPAAGAAAPSAAVAQGEEDRVATSSADSTSAEDGTAEAGSGGRTAAGTTEAAALRRFDDCAAVLSHIHEHAARAVGPWGLDSGSGFGGETGPLEQAAMDADEAAFAEPASLLPGVDYSTSNVQEAGIDEPDVLKTDGRHMVIASENRVHVVDVTDAEPSLIASIPFDDQWVSSLLLHDDRVLVFSSQRDVIAPFAEPGSAAADTEPAWVRGPATTVTEIDLSGPAPQTAGRLVIEGGYVGARLIDGAVHIVTSSRPPGIPWAAPAAAGLAAEEQAAVANRELIAATSVDDWLPRFALRAAGEVGSVVAGGRLVGCDRVWFPPHYSGTGTLSVTTIDIASDGLAGPMETSSIMSDASTVYASADRLYVSTSRWHDWRTGPPPPRDSASVQTEVHMFDITGRTTSAYVASASVLGTVLNQYSMSEHEGHLRIATTTAPAWQPWRADDAPESESFVTVLAVGGDGLSQVGQVGGLGIGERIFAVRFLGEIAAVVTFRQVDPLYLLDLSDPAAPAVRGELKITGYSAYLHPLGDSRLLGVGQEATDQGRTLGTQVSLFDIADLDRPERIAQWTARGAHSQVEFNALAFLHWQPSDLAVLPINQYPSDESGREPPFLGAVALGTAGAGLAERARFSHADPAQRRCRESREIIVRPDGSEVPGPWERYCWFDADWQAQVTASAVVGDRLYLASHKALEAVSLETLERVALLRWAR